ncbi:MAG: hypothetical protein JKX88_10075 [Marinicaulis sp.]|nr:hypothetical protein [Marinicaulis sp.]
MSSKTISALVMAAALLGAAFILSQGETTPPGTDTFLIIVGAIGALFVGGQLRRKK